MDINYTDLVLRNLQEMRGECEVDETIEPSDVVPETMALNLQSEEQMQHSLGVRKSAQMYWKHPTHSTTYATGYDRYESCASLRAPDTIPPLDTSGEGRELQCLSTNINVAQSSRLINNYKQQKFEHRFDHDRSIPPRRTVADELSWACEPTETTPSITSAVESGEENRAMNLSSTVLTLKMEKLGQLRTIIRGPSGSDDTKPKTFGRRFHSTIVNSSVVAGESE
ncbi:MAG: hypothetical protein K2X93_12080 [Candidatus Obscuribacterales bacterium]|nr:hypothetical protein [Candidatus Obscuribacterales bacterium]